MSQLLPAQFSPAPSSPVRSLPRRSGRIARLLVVLLLGIAGALLGATAASAHATLVTSTPGNGDVLDEAPSEVSLTFSEDVSIGSGYLRVLDADGERVDTGNVAVNGDEASVPLRDNLPDGGYIISYRVISADSHPVSGGVSFAVGDAAPPTIDSQGTQIGGASDDPAIAVLYPTVRWLGYAGLALVGGVLLLALIDPVLRSAQRSRTLAWIGFDVALGATVLAGLLQGPYAAGQGIGSVFDPALMSATLETGLGQMLALRLMALGVVGVLLWEWFNAEHDRRAVNWTAAGGLIAVALTHAASGHAIADGISWLSIPLTAAHLSAAAAWIGGLVGLLLIVVPRGSALSAAEQSAIAARFSTIAGWLVGVIIVSGVAEAWIRVGSWGALFETAFGRLLLAKSALLVIALGAALGSRSLVRQRTRGSAKPPNEGAEAGTVPFGKLRRTVLIETVAGAAAIALAAVLVATPPAKDTYAVAQDTTITFDNDYTAQMSLDPARTGANTLHLYLFDRNSALASIDEVTVTIENKDAQIGPLELDAQNVGQGHFIASGVELPVDGSWSVSVTFAEPGFGTVSQEGDIDVR